MSFETEAMRPAQSNPILGTPLCGEKSSSLTSKQVVTRIGLAVTLSFGGGWKISEVFTALPVILPSSYQSEELSDHAEQPPEIIYQSGVVTQHFQKFSDSAPDFPMQPPPEPNHPNTEDPTAILYANSRDNQRPSALTMKDDKPFYDTASPLTYAEFANSINSTRKESRAE